MSKTEVYRVGQYVPVPIADAAPGSAVDTRLFSGLPMQLGLANFVTVTPKGKDGNYAGNASADLGGVHLLPVTVASGPKTFGDPVYLITATGLLSTASASAVLFGYIAEPEAVPNGTQIPVLVKILQRTA